MLSKTNDLSCRPCRQVVQGWPLGHAPSYLHLMHTIMALLAYLAGLRGDGPMLCILAQSFLLRLEVTE